MALAGSTRMQATTILMHAIGIALLGCDKIREKKYSQYKNWMEYAEDNVKTLLAYMEKTDFSLIASLI